MKNVKSQKQYQLMKKLKSVTKKQQLQKILDDLQQQNQKLVEEVKAIRDRVQKLSKKNNNKQLSEKQRQLTSQNKKVKQQLAVKYQHMQSLKRSLKSYAVQDEDMVNTQAKKTNLLKDTQTTIAEYIKHAEDLKKQNGHLQQTYQKQIKQPAPNEHKIKELEQQNSELKKQIFNLRKKSHSQLQSSIKINESLTDQKLLLRKYQKINIKDIKKTQIPSKSQFLVNQEELKSEVTRLKSQIEIFKSTQFKKQSEQKLRREKLHQENQKMLYNHKGMQSTKIKLQLQLNKYKKQWQKITAIKQSQRAKKQYADQEVQISTFVDENLLRKDFGGAVGKNKFDDRLLLGDDKRTYMRGGFVYENEKGLVAIKIIYSNGVESFIPISNTYMSKCKVVKFELEEQDFLKVFKIKSSLTQNRILKIQMITNKNVRYEYGEKKPFSELTSNEVVYGLDISVSEYPVCCFGSFTNSKGNWFLESFGVEINEL